jgi:hypothetical protein
MLRDHLERLPVADVAMVKRDTLAMLCDLSRRCAGASELRPDVHGGPRPDLVQVALLPDPASRLPTPGAC